MPVVIDYSPMFKQAEEVYDRFKTAYRIIKKSERDKKPLNNTTENIVKIFCYDAFQIHPDIRETFSGLNDQLAELIEKGFLELKDEEISPFDPATRKIYFDNLSSRLREQLKKTNF